MSTAPEQLDIEVEIEEKKAEAADIEVVHADERPKKDENPEVDPEAGLKLLKDQLDRERTARINAENRANESQRREISAKNEVQDTNLSLVTNAIETVRQQNESLKASYAESLSVSDYGRAAEVQNLMSTNAAKLLQLEQGKQALESWPKAEVPRQQMSSDPVEALASQLSSRSAEWVRAHPEFARDQNKYQKMLAAHNLATADGIRADSDEYFTEIEQILKVTPRRAAEDSQDLDPMADAAKPTQRRTPPPAAPVSRSGNGTGSRPNVVRLNSAEREMASMMGMTDQEYAKNKVALQKEGKLN